MADSKKLVPFILSWETDKYTNNKKDKGGPTKYGITLATWRRVGYDKNGDGVLNEEDVKLLTKDDFHRVFKQNFWNACKADKIQDQSVANMLVDFAYNSGVKRAATYLQLTLGITYILYDFPLVRFVNLTVLVSPAFIVPTVFIYSPTTILCPLDGSV